MGLVGLEIDAHLSLKIATVCHCPLVTNGILENTGGRRTNEAMKRLLQRNTGEQQETG